MKTISSVLVIVSMFVTINAFAKKKTEIYEDLGRLSSLSSVDLENQNIDVKDVRSMYLRDELGNQKVLILEGDTRVWYSMKSINEDIYLERNGACLECGASKFENKLKHINFIDLDGDGKTDLVIKPLNSKAGKKVYFIY